MPSLEEGQKQSLKLIAEEIVKKQQPDGSWEFFATLRRPPINESQTTDAAWIIMALEGETGPDAPESRRVALSKAIAWLDAAKPSDIHQDKVLKVLMGARSGKPRETMQTTIDELLALQRADGGWSQTVPELKSDAFATGQTLYVLSLAGYTAERPEIRARDRLPGRHARAGRQLADDFSIDPRWLARERETLDADHLRRQFLGHARPGKTRAETELKSSKVVSISRASRLTRSWYHLATHAPAGSNPQEGIRRHTVIMNGSESAKDAGAIATPSRRPVLQSQKCATRKNDRNHLACPKCKSIDLDFKGLRNNMRAEGDDGGVAGPSSGFAVVQMEVQDVQTRF